MLVWIIFIFFILIFLLLDLGVFNKTAHIISNKEASIWTSIWVSISLLFSFVVYWVFENNYVSNINNYTPSLAVVKYITGYLIELSLSVDNIFVIAVIFSSFKIPQKYQHRVLFYGILGAIVFRAIMIFFGVLLIQKVFWISYVFGAFLLFTAIKMLLSREDEEDYNPKKGIIYKLVKKIIPITPKLDSEHFFIHIKHLRVATPLLLALIIIEFTDILFALDSIPAILAITSDSFLVFTSNILAIMGLRSMYFFLSNMLEKFSKLKYSLVVILSFVGFKLILENHFHFKEWISLTVIGVSLLIGILFSINNNKKSI